VARRKAGPGGLVKTKAEQKKQDEIVIGGVGALRKVTLVYSAHTTPHTTLR
jgi:hypothetical protein